MRALGVYFESTEFEIEMGEKCSVLFVAQCSFGFLYFEEIRRLISPLSGLSSSYEGTKVHPWQTSVCNKVTIVTEGCAYLLQETFCFCHYSTRATKTVLEYVHTHTW